MQLTRKLTLAIASGVAFVLAVSGALQTRREIAQFERDSTRDHQVLAAKLAAAVTEVRRLEGDRMAADVIAHASDPGAALRIRWVQLEPGGPGDPPLLSAAARRALERREEVQQVDPSGHGMLVTYHPVAGGAPALIEVSESLAEARAYTRVTQLNVGATTVAVGMVCVLIAYMLGASIVGAPIRKLVGKARRVGRGDLREPLVLRQNDEFGLLAREMNAMCENLAAAMAKAEAETAARISALEQLRHADRLATVGKLAAGIAHELGTPLNVVCGRARMIEIGEVSPEQARGSARVIAEQAQRMTAIIRQLLDFARQRGPQMGNVDLLHLVREAVDLLAPLGKKRKVVVRIAATSRAQTATISRSHMLQAVMNLIVNAMQASPEGGVVDVEVGHSDEDPAGPMATLTVTDYGQGMSREVTDHAFEPFFTTKGVGEGTGLGLSVTYGIVSEHRGFITVRSELGRGSTFCIHLPLAAPPESSQLAATATLRTPAAVEPALAQDR
jgi:signal transduction histidine kinase